MSFLKGLGGPLAGAAGGAITPLSGLGQVGGPMSGIGLLSKLFGGHGGGGESAPSPAPAPVPQPSTAANGLGNLLGVDGNRVSKIADTIGKGANFVAGVGGSAGGYEPRPGVPAVPAGLPDVQNHLQLLDPNILQAIMGHFRKAQY